MIEYRKLTHADYDDIVDICRDIWDGSDYLPDYFHDWVDSEGLMLGAVDSENGKVIGIDKFSILSDGSGWLEGLRVHKDYRGKKIAKELALMALDHAKQQLHQGKVDKLAFSTHITAVESINLMKSLDFRLEQSYILTFKSFDSLDKNLRIEDFKVESLYISYEEFVELPYLKRRAGILPFVFYYQKPTPELFEDFRKKGCFISINGHKGMYVFKGEPHYITFEESFEAVDTFMSYYLLTLKGKSIVPPLVSVIKEDTELIEKLKAAGYETWNNWEDDYLYFVYR